MLLHLGGGAAAALLLALPLLPLSGDGLGGRRQAVGNLPPVPCFGPGCQQSGATGILKCAGDETTFELDASNSYDPENQPLTFLWQSSPGSTVDDPTAPITTLRIDTSQECERTISVRCSVSDGKFTVVARLFVQVVEAVPICGDKPHQLEFVYTGDGCEASDYAQDPSGVYCAGAPLYESPVRVLVTMLHQEDRVYFDGLVEVGQAFVVDGEGQPSGKVPPNTHIQMFDPVDGTLLQESWFHTSCSQPLETGDRFGAAILTGFTP